VGISRLLVIESTQRSKTADCTRGSVFLARVCSVVSILSFLGLVYFSGNVYFLRLRSPIGTRPYARTKVDSRRSRSRSWSHQSVLMAVDYHEIKTRAEAREPTLRTKEPVFSNRKSAIHATPSRHKAQTEWYKGASHGMSSRKPSTAERAGLFSEIDLITDSNRSTSSGFFTCQI